jgi:hypothetical protein
MKYFYFNCLCFLLVSLLATAQTHQTHLLSYTTLTLEISDLDDDGDQDFLTGGISNLQWQENNGSGVFTSHTITQDFDETHAFKVVDLDGDGDKDIVASSFTTNQIIWLENDGNEIFAMTTLTAAAGSCAGLDVIDFDNDGDQDVVATGYNSDEVFWLQNNGSQVFTKNVIRVNFNGAASIRVFDVDADGDKDIVTSGILCDSIILLRNNGSQTFVQQFLHPLDGPRSLRLVDFDNDGDIDVTFAGDGGLGWILNAAGVLTPNQYSPTYTRDFLVADLNNDNFKDLIFTNYADDYITWQKNNGNSTYTGMGYIDNFINSPIAIGAADFTGDGFKEVIGVSNQEVKFCTNNAGLTFTKKALNYYMYTAKSACHGDFDNDGDVDLMAVGYFNVYFYRNDGNDQYATIKVFSTNNSFGGEEMRAADMDGDGDVDVLYTEGVGNKIVWLENQGSGNFVYRIVFSIVDPKGVFAVDYDFDGDMDVVSVTVETYSLSAVYWYENNGSEVFTEHLVNGNYAFPNGIFAMDYNQDNFMDVVAAYSGTGGSQKVILHDVHNGYNIQVNSNSQGASSVYSIDIDNDGDLDILSSGFNDYDIIWYENPSFAPHTIDGNAQGATHVFAGDMDGDGDIDVASTSATDDKVSWYENNGNQSFTKKTLATNVPYPESIEGGDIDGDGIMDLYSVCKESHSVALYKIGPAPPPLSFTTCGDLFISEYIEGSASNKAIEIYNPTAADIDLSIYSIGVYSNGSTSPSQSATLTGILAANSTYVVTHPSAVAGILNNADQTFGFNFNGDDAIGLLKGGQLIDIVGKIGEDPGTEWSSGGVSTLDKTLVRKNTVSKGSNLNGTFVANTEWDVYPIDDASHLGSHTSLCANYCPASVSINASSTSFCAGTSVTFTTSAVNQGTTPIYQWKKNGVNVATGATYTTSTLANNDTIKCIMTSSQNCAIDPSTSNSIIVTVSPSVTPTINITASATVICSGTNITFTANATNGGSAPTYVWKKNGNTVGTNASTYSSSTLANNDVITCIFTSSAGCVSTNNITSNSITITVNTSSTPSLSISATNTTICAGTAITFTATPVNGGSIPAYQWYKNNNPISGATSVTYLTSTAVNNDIFKCVLTSNSACATIPTATSNNITITVNPLPVAATITAGGPTTFCAGGFAVLSGNNNGGTWSNGGTTSTITVTTTGSYFVTNSNSCGSINSNTINITANPAPTASTISAGGATTFCAGNTVTLSGNNNGGTWSNGATTATINVNVSGNYFVTNSNNCGTINSNTIAVTVNPLPTAATITANGPTTICTGSTVTLSGNNNGGIWSNGATTSSINVTSAGNYFVTNTNGCGSVNSNTINVIVNAAPIASSINASGPTTFCAGNTVTLSGNVGGTWSNGATTATISVNASGNYFVTNSNNCGTINSNSIAVTVNPLPTPSVISANGATTICTGSTVTLSGNNNGGTWSNGATTSTINVTTAGNYFVTNTNSCGSINSNTINVIVNATPTASTISAGGATTFCAGNTVTLSGNNNGGTWSNGATTATISVNASGNYFVTNSNNCGTINSNTIAVTVNPLPIATTITANGPTTICTGSTVILSGNNNGGTWSNGATTSTINVTTAGNYFVTNTNGCGSINSNTINVMISTGPVASTIAALGSTTFCAGNTVTLNGNNGGTWSNGATSPTIVVNTGGDYYVTNTDACGSTTSNNITVTVNPQPIAASISAIGATSICNGNSVQLTGNIDGTWSNGVSINSITVTTAGNYFVTNTNSCGTVNSNTINVIVDSLPTAATISAVGSTTICDGATVILSGNINGIWSDGNTSPAIVVSVSGSYYVTNSNGCGNSNSNQIIVTVLPAPTTPIVTQVGYNLETTAGYNSYQWFNNNFPIPNETNPIFTPTSSGVYYVLVIDSNGCQTQSSVYNFVYVGLNESIANTGLTVMPNPANTFIILKSINKSTLEGNLKIWNIAGELVIEKQIAKTNQLQLDIEQWANGMYIIELAGADKTERFKFIKQQ